MNNILNLYEIEFKRTKKFYLLFNLSFLVSNLIIIIYKIFGYTNNPNVDSFSERINLLKNMVSVQNGIISNFTNKMCEVFLVFLIVSIFNTITIWQSDFDSKEKTAYTLYLLPQNRMNIFYAKSLLSINIVFTITLNFLFVCSMFTLFVNKFLDYNLSIKNFSSFALFLSHRGFFIVNILGVVCAIFVISMCVVMALFDKKMIVISVLLVFAFLGVYIGLGFLSSILSIVLIHIVYLSLLIFLSAFVSNKLIDKIDF